jgi:hypothetical protein
MGMIRIVMRQSLLTVSLCELEAGLMYWTNPIRTGKARVHCKPEALSFLNGKEVDSYGCAKQETGAVAYEKCKPSDREYEIFKTDNRRWMLFNFLNGG